MPELSRFFVIVIAIYYNDHGVPHFHAKYAGHRASIAISDLTLLEGELPRRATSLVVGRARQHREELLANWNLARAGRPLRGIAPLE